jgi:hypothetical protein
LIIFGPRFTRTHGEFADPPYQAADPPDMAINAGLRALGVQAAARHDEFATIGLNKHHRPHGVPGVVGEVDQLEVLRADHQVGGERVQQPPPLVAAADWSARRRTTIRAVMNRYDVDRDTVRPRGSVRGLASWDGA